MFLSFCDRDSDKTSRKEKTEFFFTFTFFRKGVDLALVGGVRVCVLGVVENVRVSWIGLDYKVELV